MKEKENILSVEDLGVSFLVKEGQFARKSQKLQAVDGVSFRLERGETLGVVGESGCGKTTLGRAILYLEKPTSGKIVFKGELVEDILRKNPLELRRKAQIIFQDPYTSLNPRMTVGSIIGEGIEIHNLAKGRAKQERVKELLGLVGLDASYVARYPHEFSSGQRQRIVIARALAVDPELVVCDEPVSSLDVSVGAKILNLMLELQKRLSLAYIFISHDLDVVAHMSDYIAVMYLGKFMETAKTHDIIHNARHPYTRALWESMPRIGKEKIVGLKGEIPSPLNIPSGCRFRTRCPYATELCAQDVPPLTEFGDGQLVACHYAKEIKDGTHVPTNAPV